MGFALGVVDMEAQRDNEQRRRRVYDDINWIEVVNKQIYNSFDALEVIERTHRHFQEQSDNKDFHLTLIYLIYFPL